MLERIIKHKAVSAACLSAIFITLAGFLWVYFGLRMTGSGPFVIHWNDMNGITEVGGLWSVAAVGMLGIFITVIDFFIATELEEREPFLGKVVATASALFAVLLFIAFAAILGMS
jgi:hypothetical protein